MIFVVVVYGALSSSVLPTDRPLLIGRSRRGAAGGRGLALWFLREHHIFERARDWLRPLADAPRALLGRAGRAAAGRHVRALGVEAAVYLAVAHRSTSTFSVTGALYLVALTNFVAALPPPRARSAPSTPPSPSAPAGSGRSRLEAVTYMLLLRFVLYIPITVVGLVILVARYGGWSRLRSAVTAGAEARGRGDPRLARADAGARRTAPSAAPAGPAGAPDARRAGPAVAAVAGPARCR